MKKNRSDLYFGEFSKAKSLGYAVQSQEEADRQFKLTVACVWVEWLRYRYQMPVSLEFMPPMDNIRAELWHYMDLQLDHIANKTRHDRYDLLNVQLIRPDTHRDKTDSGKYTDYRPAEFVKWLKDKTK